MEDKKFTSFEEFWPFYVGEHKNKTNRRLHFVGTSGAIGLLAAALIRRKPALALLAPIVGYGHAWIGHFFIEKNRPASFKYPLWSFRGDLKMLLMILAGAMDAEVERVIAEEQKSQTPTNGKSTETIDTIDRQAMN